MPNFKLPFGVYDVMPETLKFRRELEEEFISLFSGWGYRRIEAPVLSGYDVFRTGVGAVDPSRLFKFGDVDGSMLVMRADMTLPATRIAATKLPPVYPLRLSYAAPSFNLKPEEGGREREFHQAGVELFGVSGAQGDAEVIALAIRALLGAGLTDFRIDIGQVGILRGILANAPISEEDKGELVTLINNKALISEAEFPALKGLCDPINALMGMYGDESVLDEAEKAIPFKESRAALENLREVYRILQDYGFSEYISFDLGLVNSYSYYSGVVFKGITRHFGAPILGGGRYDHLSEVFGKNIPATGFAIGLTHILRALEKQGVRPKAASVDVVLTVPFGKEKEGFLRAEELRKIGKTVSVFYGTPEEGKIYAEKIGATNTEVLGGKA